MLAALAEQGIVAERCAAASGATSRAPGAGAAGGCRTRCGTALEGPGADDVARPPLRRARAGAPRPQRAHGSLLAGDARASSPASARWSRVRVRGIGRRRTGAISLADVLSFLGVIIVALLAGVFPVLLSSRRATRASCRPGTTRCRRALAAWASSTRSALGGVALHGLVLWEDPLQRAAALLVDRGRRRADGEHAAQRHVRAARDDRAAPRRARDDSARFSIVAAGRPALPTSCSTTATATSSRMRAATGEIPRFSSLRRAVFSPDWGAADSRPRAEDLGAPRHRRGGVAAAGRGGRGRGRGRVARARAGRDG